MYEEISMKDIIAFNSQFSKGHVINQSSALYALSEANRTKSWLHACAVLARAVLIDHVFEDGNKRTAAAIIMCFLEKEAIGFHPEEVAKVVAKMVTKNITDLVSVERLIKDVII